MSTYTPRPYWAPLSVVLVCLPAVLFVAWYLGAGYTRFERYRRATATKQTLTMELLQLFVHDELHRHLRRLTLPASPQRLPMVELAIAAGGMESLEKDVRGRGKRVYVNGRLRKDGEVYKVQVRLQGRRHWHHIGVQKSFKIRAAKGHLVDGLRTFNLVNDVTPFGLEEQIVFDVARALGLLTPDYHPIRLRLNNTDLGVYRLVGAPDEGLLRGAGRMPGSIYSGRFDRECGSEGARPTPDKPCGFSVLASRDRATRTHFGEVLGLHQQLHDSGPKQWRDYVLKRLDLDRFARFEALDVVFGGDQHDEGANLKLYFDPYRGRFEPIAMDFRAFRHDRRVNLAGNILQRRLHEVPEYMLLRNQWIHRLATGEGAPAAVRARVDRWFTQLRPELESDPYWDAYKLLPKPSGFHRLMVRPMTMARWLITSRKELDTHARRHRYLRSTLDSASLWATAGTNPTGQYLDVEVRGLGAYALQELGGDGEAGAACTLPEGLLVIQPSMKIEASQLELGRVPQTTRFRLRVRCEGPTDQPLWLSAKNVVTGRTHRLRVQAERQLGEAMVAQAEAPRQPSLVTLGPGIVVVDQDLHFDAATAVQVLPGTTLRLGPGVSVTFEGRLSAVGTSRAPIRFEAADPGQPFGGVRLLGPHSEGSVLRHVNFVGGSHPAGGHRYTPGFLSIYETANIQLSHLRFSAIENAEDVLHLTYVENASIDDVEIRGAPVDAIDLEMVQGSLRGLRVLKAGDECLDLMGAKIQVTDSLLLGCTNNAVSAGEGSEVSIDSLFVGRSRVGILAKNASTVQISRSVVFGCEQGLRTNRKDVHYNSPSRLDADTVFLHEVDELRKQGVGTSIRLLHSVRGLPQQGQLRALRMNILDLERWDEQSISGFVREVLL